VGVQVKAEHAGRADYRLEPGRTRKIQAFFLQMQQPNRSEWRWVRSLAEPTGILAMFRFAPILAGLTVLAAMLSAVLARDESRLPAPRSQAVVESLAGTCTSRPDYLGTASCTSSSCHHKSEHRRVVGSEFVTWNSEDPHRKAFDTLYSIRSERMVRNLYGPDAASASKTVACLTCHATGEGQLSKASTSFSLVDAVSCESCHGPAQPWLAAHTQGGFKELDAATKERDFGLWNTKDLARRAQVCSACHVGNPDVPLMQVNHDLIAAGHPRLNFEFSSALAKYPAHWRMADEHARTPDHAWRSWQVGQIAVATAAVRLTEARARRSADGAPWPEFAEQDCFSCHKNLTVDSDRVAYRTPTTAGRAPWQTWYTGALDLADSEAYNTLASLKTHMGKPAPDAATTATRARKALEGLTRRIAYATDREPWTTAQELEASTRIARFSSVNAEKLTWEQQAQQFLALAALRDDLRRRQGQIEAGYELPYLTVRDSLLGQFPNGYDSPRSDPNEMRATRDRQLLLKRLQDGLDGIARSQP